jgi:hypothetical protein
MDIESFYEQNEARRESAEFEFGSEWTDAADNEYELSWVEATGELYLMVEPDAVVNEDIFGDFLVSDEVISDLTVVIIGKVASLAGLEDTISGWEDASRGTESTSRQPGRAESVTPPDPGGALVRLH